jgi:serine/threonine-protein kinase
VDRDGKAEPLAAQPDAYVNPRISPDGKQLALGIGGGIDSGSIWRLDLVRPTRTRLTSDKGADFSPLWTPDGKQIAYVSFRPEAGGYFLNRRAANGTGKEETITGGLMIPSSWSGDGKSMIVTKSVSLDPRNLDIGTLSMQGGHTYKPLLQEKHNEYQPRVSPDGQWIVYTSDESGRDEIYVRPFPDVEKDKLLVSNDGGHSPLWSRDGREIFYRSGDAVMAIPVNPASGFTAGAPKTLFRGVYVSLERAFSGTRDLDPWDISHDGKRFLMMKESGPAESAAAGIHRINIVLNWFEDLKQRAPAK